MSTGLVLQEDLELSNASQVRIEATRYLFTPLDTIIPARKRDLARLVRGGVEIESVCLKRTSNYVPRAFLTPLEHWAEWLPKELVPENTRTVQAVEQKAEGGVGNPLHGQSVYPPVPLFGVPHYPGEHIPALLLVPVQERKGLVEITPLRDVDWKSGQPQKLQQLFFPDAFFEREKGYVITLREIVERVLKVKANVQDKDVQTIADQALEACEQSRLYGENFVDVETARVKEGRSHQHTYTYGPQARLLMAQLEIAPQDRGFQLLAESQSELVKGLQQGGVTPDMLEQMQKQNATFMQTALETVMAAAGKAFAEAVKPLAEQVAQIQSAQPAPAEPARPEDPKDKKDKSGK
jgi:hypothetical protein